MRIVLFANSDWYLYNFRRSLALALRERGHDVILISPSGRYGEKLRSLGLIWKPISMGRRSVNPLREASVLLQLVRVFRAERPDLVHGFTIKGSVYGSIAARLAGVRYRVSSIAGMGYVFVSPSLKARFLRPILRGLLRLAFRGRGVRVVLQNPDDFELFSRERFVGSEYLHLILGSGVDTARFMPRPGSSTGERVRVLFPARLLWDKGLAEYIYAARLLRERGVFADFLLAGSPDEGNPATVDESTVRAWADDGSIAWLGHVDDMPSLLASVDVVVLPSYREGLPKVLIEAGASGCALVATDVPGCREVVEHEVDGLLVAVRDGASLADAIQRLTLDPNLRARLGNAARAKAVSRFDERIVLSDTIGLYEGLVR